MNVENIHKVADAIEKHSIPGLGFNMQDFLIKDGHNCETTACICGHAVILEKWRILTKSELETINWFSEGKRILGLKYHEAYELFMSFDLNLGSVLSAQAVRTLRHLAATGEVRWDLPEPAAA